MWPTPHLVKEESDCTREEAQDLISMSQQEPREYVCTGSEGAGSAVPNIRVAKKNFISIKDFLV